MPRASLSKFLCIFSVFVGSVYGAAGKIDFNRDIRPILSENCFQCHGQDPQKREAKLRLDDSESATRDRDGHRVIAPGRPAESELVLRLKSADPDERMPPAETNKHVTREQVALIERWIAEGAPYQKHWAFVAPLRPAAPPVRAGSWPHSDIDRFVLARLEAEKLAPSPAAPPTAWLRRASFDLTGLPPTPQEFDAFAADVARRGEPAYTAAADRLMGSAHFGERLAMDWLDAARYADTHGFNNDSSRTMWRWRDWVIDAFNTNMPYDRFITEQLAGDLLPQPTLEQRIATGFGRNHVISSEGGIIEEEYRVEYVADRVRTLSTAWLGLTMECARCHDHKFDPVQQRDYYRFFAFFNNVPEHGEDGRVANAVPMMPAPTREQQEQLATQERALAALDAKLHAARARWQWQPADHARGEKLAAAAQAAAIADKPTLLLGPEQPEAPKAAATATAGAPAEAAAPAPADTTAPKEREPDAPKIPAAKLDFSSKEGITLAFWLKPEADNPPDVALFSGINYSGTSADSGYGKGRELRLIEGEIELRLSDRFPMYAVVVRTVDARIRADEWRHVAVTYAGGKKAADVRFFVDGAEVSTRVRYDDLFGDAPKREFLVGTDNAKGAARWRGTLDDVRSFQRPLGGENLRALFQAKALPRALAEIAGGPVTEPARHWLSDALLADDATHRDLFAQRAELNEKHLALRRSLPSAMVMEELPQPRQAFVLNRGQYDAHGEPVEPGVPEALLVAWPEGAPRNRLGLARWLTRPDHPLTARVVVNRFWAQLFGTGLAKSLEDFGSQSEWPSHPEILDWLAREFVDNGWNVKALLRTLVLSATYRQSSTVSPALVARDPENRLLARGPRLRLPAELIRDQALAVSGLLAPRIGGPSVYPYQPEKLYEGIVVGAAYPGTTWLKGTGEELYRRSLYTFWKRTVPHPAMIAFDAPDREFCTVRRSRTNTPLQALALWNEPGYVEAARRLATRMVREGGPDDASRIAFGFQSATGRRPGPKETRVLAEAWARLRADFAAHEADAAALLKTGASSVDGMIPPAELAAATALASMILNLDETITKN